MSVKFAYYKYSSKKKQKMYSYKLRSYKKCTKYNSYNCHSYKKLDKVAMGVIILDWCPCLCKIMDCAYKKYSRKKKQEKLFL